MVELFHQIEPSVIDELKQDMESLYNIAWILNGNNKDVSEIDVDLALDFVRFLASRNPVLLLRGDKLTGLDMDIEDSIDLIKGLWKKNPFDALWGTWLSLKPSNP